MKIFNKKRAFTLAELLLTISVIGVLAALTIPNLAVRTQERELMSRFKAVYSRVSSALEAASVDKTYRCYEVPVATLRDKYFNLLPNVINGGDPAVAECDNGAASDGDGYKRTLWPHMRHIFGSIRTFDVSDDSNLPDNIKNYMTKFDTLSGGQSVATINVMKDGSYIMHIGSGEEGDEGEGYHFFIDTNGLRGPNELGRDVFLMAFFLSDAKVKNDKIYPRKVSLYPENIANNADPQVIFFKRAIGAK
ncbi:type II secretion system protein [bacterium]|nr:type II secretion system protein [bacterium]